MKETINSEKYCAQLDIFKAASVSVDATLTWGKNFDNLNDIQNHLDKFFASKPEGFYRTGIEKLHGWWQKVLENNGHYVIDWKYICL